MKTKKYDQVSSCCWGLRHELVGLILLIIATLLTLFTGNGWGILGMFIAGVILFGHKCWSAHCHCHSHCHSGMADHCHTLEEDCGMMSPLEKEEKVVRKPSGKKTKV